MNSFEYVHPNDIFSRKDYTEIDFRGNFLKKNANNLRHEHYVDNKKLLNELFLYKEKCNKAVELGKDKPKVSDPIAVDIYKICDHLSFYYKFINYSYKEEMVGDAILSCLQAVENFDPALTDKAFSYFTQIAFHAFVNRINKEQKQHYIKHKNIYNSMNSELLNEIQYTSTTKEGVSLVDASDRIIEQYEEKVRRIKEKQENKKKEEANG